MTNAITRSTRLLTYRGQSTALSACSFTNFGGKNAGFCKGKMSLPVSNSVFGAMMVMQDRTDISDGCRWRCPECRKAVSIRKGSFFSKSKLPLQKWLLLMHWWSRQYSVKAAAEEVGVSEVTAIQVYSWMRDVCSYRLGTLDPPIKLGGPGIVVAIDESLFST